MQTLGLADSTPRSEGRLKSLFWPSVQNAWDVDYLGQQGFWICFVVAVMSLGGGLIGGHLILGSLTGLFFFLSGVGIRERSVMAGAAAFFYYTLDFAVSIIMLMPGNPMIRTVICILLFSNLRGTWIASRWKQPDASSPPDEMPMRFNDTWRDKLVDQMPARLWPKVRFVYYAFAVVFLALTLVGVSVYLAKGRPAPARSTPAVRELNANPPG